jgi:hypothetical protein
MTWQGHARTGRTFETPEAASHIFRLSVKRRLASNEVLACTICS